MSLPPGCPKPCNDCPWRRKAAPGWLGPMPGEDWISLAMSDEPIACHETIKETDDDGNGDWSDPRMRQCTGAAIFRRNNGKLPRNSEDAAASVSADRETVFATRHEFLDHHASLAKKREDPCGACPTAEAEWECTICRGHYCNDCIDAFNAECPECLTDPGWMPLDDADEAW